MRYIPRAGADPSFMIKAMREASGEMHELMWGMRLGSLLRPGQPPDEDWSLMGICYHLNAVEGVIGEQLERMITMREPRIPHADLDAIPFPGEYDDCDEEELLEEFHHKRSRNSYLLWDLSMEDWDRGGLHPYRGRRTVRETVRELYQHDLEHLWQARRMVEALGGRGW
ncbi:MAG: DinB family protein [Dehalococcoidia bacterium]|nr:DinB family protein [Dehalococcoidia bacterium]MCA9844247.1 DinB family protein [Dehalococcoidia bacterium]MCA9852740.1 DinB family protein [Dehalococcoidia bacterium]